MVQFYIEYCWAYIQYTKSNYESTPKFHGVNVAHSNSSITEAWFSLVCSMNLDSATTYDSPVGNKLMRNTCSLKTNGIYCRNQVGEIVRNKAIGPTLIINFHAKRQKSVFEFIEKKTSINSMLPTEYQFPCSTKRMYQQKV